MTKQWQVGFVGLRRGSGLVRSLAGHPHVQVAALCDLDENALTKLGADFGVAEQQMFTRYDDFVNAPIDIVYPLRYPNGLETVELIAEAIHKVMNNVTNSVMDT